MGKRPLLSEEISSHLALPATADSICSWVRSAAKWVHLDSNQGPTGYEPDALTAELWTRETALSGRLGSIPLTGLPPPASAAAGMNAFQVRASRRASSAARRGSASGWLPPCGVPALEGQPGRAVAVERRGGGERRAQPAQDLFRRHRELGAGDPRVAPVHHRQARQVVLRLRRREARLPEELDRRRRRARTGWCRWPGRARRARPRGARRNRLGATRRRRLAAGGLHQGGPEPRARPPAAPSARRSRGGSRRGSLMTSGTSSSCRPRLPPFRICPFSPNSSPWVGGHHQERAVPLAARPQGLRAAGPAARRPRRR